MYSLNTNKCKSAVVTLKNGCALEWSPDFGEMTLGQALGKMNSMNSALPRDGVRWRFPLWGIADTGETEWGAAVESGLVFAKGSYFRSFEDLDRTGDENHRWYRINCVTFTHEGHHCTWRDSGMHKIRCRLRLVRNIPGYFKVWKTLIKNSPKAQPDVLSLVDIGPNDVGFDSQVSLADFYDQAEKLGLVPCSREIAKRIRPKLKGLGTNTRIAQEYEVMARNLRDRDIFGSYERKFIWSNRLLFLKSV